MSELTISRQPTFARRTYLAVSAFSFGAVAVAAALQFSWGLYPCSLCIIQRYGFLIVGLAALAAAMSPHRAWPTLLSFGALAGFAAAARNIWVQHFPSPECGRDALSSFLNGLPTVDLWPAMFEATGMCSDPIPDVLGLSFPAWGALGFFLALLLTFLAQRRMVG